MERRKFLVRGSSGLAGLLMHLSAGERNNTGVPHSVNYQNNRHMTSRMKTFDVPHKGIRNGLSQLSLLSGKTNYNDRSEVERLNALGKEVFLLLNTHAQDENDVSLKYLEEKMKGASHHDLEEHVRLHVLQSRLEKMLNDIWVNAENNSDASDAGSEFYSSLADFHSEYLHHMSEEERITQRLLWDNFTDQELAQHRVEIMKNLPVSTLFLWFKYVAPAQSHQERVSLFKGFKQNAPAELFQEAMKIIKSALDESEFKELIEAL